MNAPVDQRAAAGNRFCRKRAAEARNRAMGAKADINMIYLPEFPVVNQLLDFIDAGVETVADANV
ncbi:hypothetical protein SDC9_176879 [bioreactor metagenome]|uniref:Uncharacterized protein n=1 Tax=bioreactor metagenome TaxID=1076179 RepID=A0A645GT73_9ZZZZ